MSVLEKISLVKVSLLTLSLLATSSMVTPAVAAPGKFKSYANGIVCASVNPEATYTLGTPLHGRFVRFGNSTLCYISVNGAPDSVTFVETTGDGAVTDAGTIELNPDTVDAPLYDTTTPAIILPARQTGS